MGRCLHFRIRIRMLTPAQGYAYIHMSKFSTAHTNLFVACFRVSIPYVLKCDVPCLPLLLFLLLFLLAVYASAALIRCKYRLQKKLKKIYFFALTHSENLANFNNSNVHLLQRASVKCPKCLHVVANCLICVRRCSPTVHTYVHTSIYIFRYVYVSFYVYSILDGNENVTVFVAATAAAAFNSASSCLMIVSKLFVWSKNNYADERI